MHEGVILFNKALSNCMKNLFRRCLFFVGLFITTSGIAQTAFITGVINDTINKQVLKNTSITLIGFKDSVLIGFTRSNANGQFTLNKIKPGKYALLITHPTYADYSDELTITDTATEYKMGTIPMTLKAHLLETVMVQSKLGAIRFKGDTTEYIADSFKVGKDANVEALLKKMPGFTVNSKGEIIAQGKKVEKVLVDGEEFFGDDPTIATQNLGADAVAKVQVYEGGTDQSKLTGVEDGEKVQTVNIILKEDKKRGYFGKVEAGADFTDYYDAQAMANYFKGNKKISGYTKVNRTGRNNFNWGDAQDFGMGGVSTFIGDDGSVMSYYDGGGFSNEGIPTNTATGFNYTNKFGPLKSSTNNNINTNHNRTKSNGTSLTQNILTDTVFNTLASRQNSSSQNTVSLNTRNEFNLDSSTTLNLNIRGNIGKVLTSGNNYSESYNEVSGGGKVPVNNSVRNTINTQQNQGFIGDFFLRKKLDKKGSQLAFSAGYSNTQNTNDGFLYTQNLFFSGGIPAGMQIIDQKKEGINRSSSFNSGLSFTKAFNKKTSIVFNYNYALSKSDQETKSLEKKAGKYDSLNLLFSNHYLYDNISHKGGARYVYN
jgi:hypothetical protein